MSYASLQEEVRNIRLGIAFSVLTLLFGFSLGITFGVFEDDIQTIYTSKAQEVKESVYNNDDAKINKTLGKAWVYLKRAHIHANGLGTTSLVLCLLLIFLGTNHSMKSLIATMLGLGSLGYSVFWMLASIYTPSLGSPDLAKEKFAFLAMVSVGMVTLGLASIFIGTLQNLFKRAY